LRTSIITVFTVLGLMMAITTLAYGAQQAGAVTDDIVVSPNKKSYSQLRKSKGLQSFALISLIEKKDEYKSLIEIEMALQKKLQLNLTTTTNASEIAKIKIRFQRSLRAAELFENEWLDQKHERLVTLMGIAQAYKESLEEGSVDENTEKIYGKVKKALDRELLIQEEMVLTRTKDNNLYLRMNQDLAFGSMLLSTLNKFDADRLKKNKINNPPKNGQPVVDVTTFYKNPGRIH